MAAAPCRGSSISQVMQQSAFLRGAREMRPAALAKPSKRAALTSQRCTSLVAEGARQQPTRREALQLAALVAAAPLLGAPAATAAEKGARGFVLVKDQQDAYSFAYPFGWQEVQVDGQDVVFKDVIEPLESVSVNLVPTDKADVGGFGEVKEVCFTLADKVLTGPTQEVTLVRAEEREQEGRKYYDFEFVAKSRGYTRHAAASVTVANGKFYTLVTGSNEKRWGRMREKIGTVIKSFQVSNRYD